MPTISASADPNVSQYTSTIAHVKGDSIDVSDTPGGPTTMTVKAEDVLTVPDKTPLVLLAKTVQKDGIEVYLPVRPNGTTGWVDPADVDLYATDYPARRLSRGPHDDAVGSGHGAGDVPDRHGRG